MRARPCEGRGHAFKSRQVLQIMWAVAQLAERCTVTAVVASSSLASPPKQSSKYKVQLICDKKQMKAERNNAPNTLRGTLLLRTANSRTLAKHRVRHPVEGSLPSSRKRYFDYQKTKGAGLKPPREAARSLQVSRFFVEIWERESAPAD